MNNRAYGSPSVTDMIQRFRLQRGLVFGLLIISALLAFEIFNFGTTEFALNDLLGDLNFLGIRWATILAVAFCGIDFAGIARLFTPQTGSDEPAEVWYLFGAWMLAATMNAMLTWWGVSLAVINHQTLGNAVIDRAMLLKVVPIFVAVMVWLIRVLIIGSFSIAGEKLFATSRQRAYNRNLVRPGRGSLPADRLSTREPLPPLTRPTPSPLPSGSYRPSQRPSRNIDRPTSGQNGGIRPEPTYHPVGMSGRNPDTPSRRIDR